MFFDELSNDEWALLAALVSDEPAVRLNRRGRPRAEPRVVANAVLWILSTGEPWSKLPGRYPSGPTCRRRFEEWQLNGTLMEMVRLLSQTGRTFVYVPQASQPAPAKPVAVQPEVVSVREDTLRGVSWKSPESWQRPAGVAHGLRTLDPLADMTRQLAGSLPQDAQQAAPSAPQAPQSTYGNYSAHTPHGEAPVTRDAMLSGLPPHHESPRTPPPMSVAARGTQIVDRRGYVIYVTAEQVPNAMYRAWAEIEQDGRRVERSGLVGPRFANPDDALGYALEWARLWIDRQDVSSNAAASVPAPEAYPRPLPPVRSMPPVPTVTSAGVHADATASTPQVGVSVNGASAGGHLGKPNVLNTALHGQVGGLRAPLRRYPGEATTDSTAERYPTAAELISHAG